MHDGMPVCLSDGSTCVCFFFFVCFLKGWVGGMWSGVKKVWDGMKAEGRKIKQILSHSLWKKFEKSMWKQCSVILFFLQCCLSKYYLGQFLLMQTEGCKLFPKYQRKQDKGKIKKGQEQKEKQTSWLTEGPSVWSNIKRGDIMSAGKAVHWYYTIYLVPETLLLFTSPPSLCCFVTQPSTCRSCRPSCCDATLHSALFQKLKPESPLFGNQAHDSRLLLPLLYKSKR